MFGLDINNFRSLIDQKFTFERVNVLVGENSSGKSSLMKFILLLSRSMKLNTSNFRYSNELGKYKDFIHMQKDELTISFAFNFFKEYTSFFLESVPDKNTDWSEIRNELKNLPETFHNIKIEFTFDKDIQKSNLITSSIENPYFGKVILQRIKTEDNSVIRENNSYLKFNSSILNKSLEIESVRFEQYGFLSMILGSDLKENFLKNKDFGEKYFYHLAYLLIVQNYIRDLLSKVSYINPIASTPERIYEENEKQGIIYRVKSIKDVVNILSDETLEKPKRNLLLQKLNESLQKFGILHEVNAISSPFGAKELRVKVNKDSIWTNIKDVGYGSSLQIPILFQAIIGEMFGGEIILIEQPEVHIHPYLQSKFIETLLGLGNKNNYIIETHSADIIRKLQVLVKNNDNDVKSDDINIYYFKKPFNKSEISKHSINIHGKLEPKFPSGFYDSSINLVKELF